mgnify:CR=1 FL=1
MPALQHLRQAAAFDAWLSNPIRRSLLLEAQTAWGEGDAGALGGQIAVRLLPSLDWPLADNIAHYSGVWTVALGADGWHGAWRAEPGDLPLATGSVSRLDLRFVLESVPEPARLLAECARVLREDGRLLMFGLNPYGVVRLRWARHGLVTLSRRQVTALLKDEGFEVLAQRTLGPFWRSRGVDIGTVDEAWGWGRVAWAILATRRSLALTPLRRGAPTWRVTPGVPAS